MNYLSWIYIFPLFILFKGVTGSSPISKISFHDIFSKDVYVSLPYGANEILINDIYPNEEISINDHITKVDDIQIYSGDMQELMSIVGAERVLAVIDDDIDRNGGKKLLGFVKLTTFIPNTITLKRNIPCLSNDACLGRCGVCENGACVSILVRIRS